MTDTPRREASSDTLQDSIERFQAQSQREMANREEQRELEQAKATRTPPPD
jgi:hypothetical protein